MPEKDTLCWWCKNALGTCDWSRSFKPIDGWQARETVLADYCSYHIIACPLFERDRQRPKTINDVAKELGISRRTYYRRMQGLRNED